jgi:hypothetical protein
MEGRTVETSIHGEVRRRRVLVPTSLTIHAS